MEQVRHLYVMISRTQTFMGKLIRLFVRYPYNHVSLTLDPTLQRWVSFARFRKDAPLYGGYIQEPVERYLAGCASVQVRIFRLEISEERYRQLETLFEQAGSNQKNGLIYNTFDAVASATGHHVTVPNAYTCLSFACQVLGENFKTIQELDMALSAHLFFEGELSRLVRDSGRRDDPYFARLGAMKGSWRTAKHFARLSKRAFRRKQPDWVKQLLQDKSEK